MRLEGAVTFVHTAPALATTWLAWWLLLTSLDEVEEVLAVARLHERLRAFDELLIGEESHAPRDLLWHADLQALACLDSTHKACRISKRIERAGIEPGRAAGRTSTDSLPSRR